METSACMHWIAVGATLHSMQQIACMIQFAYTHVLYGHS